MWEQNPCKFEQILTVFEFPGVTETLTQNKTEK